VEIKNIKTKDKMSESQISYSESVSMTGGIYYVAKDFFSFYAWFKSHFEPSERKLEYWQFIIDSDNMVI
jgi:hypothetical protein